VSEFRTRLLFPFGVTLGGAAVIVVVVFSLSRVLLALEQESGSTAATVVAIAGATAVLLGAVWSVARRRPGSRPVVAVLLGAGYLLVAAGSYSYAVIGDGEEGAGELAGGGSAAAEPQPPVTITAFDLGFKETQVTSAAGDVEVRYANEGELDHTLVFDGVPGSSKLEVPAGGTTSGTVKLAPGTYAYFCDLPGHRAAGMEGSLTVTPGGSGPPGKGVGTASTAEVLAQDIAFEPTEVTVPAGPVEITLTNKGAILHSLLVEGVPGFKKLEAADGATATGTLDASPGTYVYYCDQPGHRAAGMEGKLTVK
jgi:plastocyanin